MDLSQTEKNCLANILKLAASGDEIPDYLLDSEAWGNMIQALWCVRDADPETVQECSILYACAKQMIEKDYTKSYRHEAINILMAIMIEYKI